MEAIRTDHVLTMVSSFGRSDFPIDIIFEEKFTIIGYNIILSLVLGLFSWNFYFFLDRNAQFRSWTRVGLMGILLFFLAGFFYLGGEIMITSFYNKNNFEIGELSSFRSFFIYFLYLGVGNTLLFSSFQFRDILGPEMYRSILKGNYASPQQERRVFMFLDLNDSTKIAEKLGHIKYSEFLQDVFHYMTDPIYSNEATIYQYIGDEIVLTWKTELGLKDCNCINVFYDIEKGLMGKNEFFLEKYGIIPKFKAGVHRGVVTGVQVGVIKRELAFHGDVLNTAARLQAKCKELNVPILVSEDVKEKLPYDFVEMGEYMFKGKSVPTKIYTIAQDQKL